MVSLIDTAKTIEHTVYLLMVLRDYCKANDNIIEIEPLKHGLENILRYIDNVYVELLDEKIL